MSEQTIGAAEAKAHFLRLLSRIEAGGEPVVVTRRGRPVARIVPLEQAKSERQRLWGALAGRGPASGRAHDPVSAPDDWSAINGEEDDLY